MDCLHRVVRLKFFTALFILATITSIKSYGDAPPTCYRLQIKNSPEREVEFDTHSEVWCYQNILTPQRKLFIYNADQPQIKPELSLILDEAGVITHGSLVAGKLSVHQVQSKVFNPFSVPLVQPKNQKPIKNLTTNQINLLQTSQAFKYLISAAKSPVANFSLNISEPKLQSVSTVLPWRGYWWPRQNGSILRPLAKYDRFVESQTGVNPGTVVVENTRHPRSNVTWSGHCNGWAASSILRAEPSQPRTDLTSGITFSVSDQKGILAEADYCVPTAFFGNRNRGGGNKGDIRPELFHKTLLYYVGELQKPLALDVHSSPAVDNHIISAYDMEIAPMSAHTFLVTATVTIHGYDHTIIEIPGVAPTYTKIYKYNLTTDESGQPIGGTWISENPDFMWVPLSPGHCQKIEEQWLNTLLSM